MTKLNELIDKYCPNGVEYKELRDLACYANKKIDSAELDKNTYVSVENLLQNKQGKTYANSLPTSAKVVKFEIGDILIGNIRPYLKKIWLSDCIGGTNGDVLVVQIKNQAEIIPEFLYYVLSSDLFFAYDVQNSHGAKMPRGSKEAVMKYRLPVPPLEVQREIVHILDSFTLLTAELTARKKQYEFYRDELLTFDTDVKIEPLGKVCELQAGKAIKAFLISEEKTPMTLIPCYGANGLRGYVNDYNQEGDKSVIGRQGALCGNVCYATGKYYATEHAVVVTDKGYFNSRYLFHALTHADLNQYKTAGAQPGLSVSRLNEVKIAVPNRNVQDKIANVLDNFESICTDLNIGLPAEIEARQKQ